MATIRNSFSKIFQIEEGEGLTFTLLSLSLFLAIGGTFVIGRTVSRSLFLSNLPPELISIRFIAVTIGVVLVSLIYTRYSVRFRRDKLILGSTALMAGGVLLFWLLLATPLGESLLILGGLFVFLEICAALTLIQFWTFASDLLNSREAKRLFNPISSMGSLGGIVAGAVVTVAAASIGAANLLLVLFVTQIGFIICVWTLGRQHKATLETSSVKSPQRASPKTSLIQGFHEIRVIPLLFSIAAIGVLTSMVYSIVEYQFDLTLQTNFLRNEDGMASFLGSFYFWTGVIGFAFQLLVAGRLLRTYGLSLSLVVLPLSFALGSTTILATGAALWAVTLTRSSALVFRYNLNDTAISLLDLPLGRDVRARTRAVINGILKPLTIGLAGLIFLVVGNLRGISPLPWSFLVLALVVVWLFLIRRVSDQYQQTLSTSILRRRFDPAHEEINISDETTINVLLAALRQPDEAQILQALSLVQEAPEVDWSSALIPLLDHPLTAVRIEALHRLGQPLYAPYAPLVLEQVNAPEGDVRAAAITAVCAIRGAGATADISPYLDDKDPVVRGAAVTGIILYGDLDGILQAELALKSMLDHPDPAMRSAGADTLGRLEVKSFFQPLLLLLEDEDPVVQNHALLAAGVLGHPDLLPSVIGHLGSPATTAAAIQALLAFGPDSCPTLGQFLGDEDVDLIVRRQIPKVLGRITTPESAAVLLQHLDAADDYSRARIYKALVRLQARGVPIAANEELFSIRLQAELRLAFEASVTRIDLNHDIQGSLLADTLAVQQRYALDRVFFLLGLLYPASDMAEIHFSVVADDPRRRANATELLDTTITRPIKNLLLPLLEGPEDRVLSIATTDLGLRRYSALERASQLAASGDDWITACTLYTFSQANWSDLRTIIDECLQSDVSLLRETAIAAAPQIFPEDEFLGILHTQAADDTLPSVSRYAQHGLSRRGTLTQQGARIMPLSTVERVLFLRGADLFRDIAGEDLVLIAQVCQEVYFPAGELFIRQGDIGDCLYILVEGSVDIELEGAGKIDQLGPKDVVGEMALISRDPRSANCLAQTDLTTLRIDHDDFWDLMAEKSGLALGVIRVLSSRLSGRLAAMSDS